MKTADMRMKQVPILTAVCILFTANLIEFVKGNGTGKKETFQGKNASCIDTDRFYDHTTWTDVQEQEPVRYLFCPLDNASVELLQNSTVTRLEWQKNCTVINFTSNTHLSSDFYRNGTAYLTFYNLSKEDAGNYTCTVYISDKKSASFTVRVTMEDNPCNTSPEFLSPVANNTFQLYTGDDVIFNCTAKLHYDSRFSWCDFSIKWLKDGVLLASTSHYTQREKSWFDNNATNNFLSSILTFNITSEDDYGVYSCLVRNSTAVFTLKSASVSHTAAVLAVLLVLIFLLLAVLLFAKCRLNGKLWYRNKYGELEVNDGKLYDAYVSYAGSAEDRKFVNFILKPHLENKYNYRLFLDDSNILPNLEPSAEVIMNVSRCRRFIVVLSRAYLEQEWCTTNFSEGLWRLLELSTKPIFIIFETQSRGMAHPALRKLKSHSKRVTVILWTSRSVTPSSHFWKEMCLALPRKVSYQCTKGNPQIHLQEDNDPILLLNADYLDCSTDPDPEGDLGVRGPIYKGPPPRVSALPSVSTAATSSDHQDLNKTEIDVSDLGSRNYETRSDFYCLVKDDDV